MKTAIPSTAKDAPTPTRSSQPHSSSPHSGRLAQLADMMKQSPQVQKQLNLAEEIQNGEPAQRQKALAAKINQGTQAVKKSAHATPLVQHKAVIQKTPPSDEDWVGVNGMVTALRQKSWVQSAFPVAQGSQVALKNINSEGICRTIVLEWLRKVKSNHRTDYLQKFTSGDVDDLVAKDNEYMKQSAIFAARNGPSAPAKEQVDIARVYMTSYLSVGGTLMDQIVPNSNQDTQAVIGAVTRDGFYNVSVHWMDGSGEKGHALGIIKNGSDYYFLDPSFYEVKGSSTVLAFAKGVLDTTYGARKTSPRYGLLFAAGTIDSGWCFLTTAAAEARGLPDNCQELMILRRYRDGYLRRRKDGPEAIQHYYKAAPRILKAIAGRDDRSEILDHIYDVVLDCINHIHHHRNAEAFNIYRQMVTGLEAMLGL